MTTEWAIQEKTLLDGDFDRLRTGHGPFDSIPYTLYTYNFDTEQWEEE